MQKVTPCLWFDRQAEQAAKFYTSIFKNSKTGKIAPLWQRGRKGRRTTEGFDNDH